MNGEYTENNNLKTLQFLQGMENCKLWRLRPTGFERRVDNYYQVLKQTFRGPLGHDLPQIGTYQ